MDITQDFARWFHDFTCGHCQSRDNYSVVSATTELFAVVDEDDWPRVTGLGVGVVKCEICHNISVIMLDIKDAEEANELGFAFADPDEEATYVAQHSGLVEFVPHMWGELHIQGQYPYGFVLDRSVPEEIRTDLLEAYNCLAVGAANASAVMSRRVIEGSVSGYRLPGSDSRTPLGAKLALLKDAGKIDGELYEGLVEVKNWGNIGAHADRSQPIEIEDARAVVRLATALVKRLFPEIVIRTATEQLRDARWRGRAA